MADEHQEVESAGAFLIKLREGIRQELNLEYADRLRQAREQIRQAQDLADAQNRVIEIQARLIRRIQIGAVDGQRSDEGPAKGTL